MRWLHRLTEALVIALSLAFVFWEMALAHVFDPAFSTTSSGSGLGLAIARRLVESWGGTIGLTSRQGAGTTVTITFQVASAARGT